MTPQELNEIRERLRACPECHGTGVIHVRVETAGYIGSYTEEVCYPCRARIVQSWPALLAEVDECRSRITLARTMMIAVTQQYNMMSVADIQESTGDVIDPDDYLEIKGTLVSTMVNALSVLLVAIGEESEPRRAIELATRLVEEASQ